jgi:FixJ family two-component response regulator
MLATEVVPAKSQIEAANFLNLLIVDDERAIREACREVGDLLGFNTFVADSAEHAYKTMDAQPIDVVLLDLRLPGASGLEALHEIKARRPDAAVLVVTGYATVQSAVRALKDGAYDYVTKPFSVEELKLLLERVSNHLKLKSENRLLREKIKSKHGFGNLIGRAPEMEKRVSWYMSKKFGFTFVPFCSFLFIFVKFQKFSEILRKFANICIKLVPRCYTGSQDYAGRLRITKE